LPSLPIVHFAAGLGQGGTERLIEVVATAPSAPAGQHAFALDGLGPTGERLTGAGVPVKAFGGDIEAAAAAIRALGPAIVILHRAGRPEQRWHRLLAALKGGQATVVEVNVFGWRDPQAIALGLKGSWCFSGAALAKYLRLTFGGWPSLAEIERLPIAVAAGHNPLGADDFAPVEDRIEARRNLGLPADAKIVLRTGRPDWRKWSDLALLYGGRLGRDIPGLRMAFVSAPANRIPILKRLTGGSAMVAAFAADRSVVRRWLAAADVMLHQARYGESFGYAVAEAQAAGLPVIVQSTPWGDNAQTMIVRHGETGFIAHTYAETRLYLQMLLADPTLAARIGAGGRNHARASFSVERTWPLLGAFLSHVLDGGTGLIDRPVDLAAEQRMELARGIAAYSERFPRLARLAAEAPLYVRPWWWRLQGEDVATYLRARLAGTRKR
jgi:glycosyltransferase involved in cell wall biosynthesis